jgi:hypothetical protein
MASVLCVAATGLVGVENCVQDAALVQLQFDLLFRDRTGVSVLLLIPRASLSACLTC